MQRDVLPDKINLLGMDRPSLQDFFVGLGERSFHAVQVLKWIYQYAVIDFAGMTNLSKQLRQRLQELCVIELPNIVEQKLSKDGTYKWLIAVAGGGVVETVFIPEKTRGTLCVSTQIGCALNCSFCLTAKQGFSRNLTAAEIIGQIWLVTQQLQGMYHSSNDNGGENQVTSMMLPKITNVVMMGMGEPLLNFAAVAKAIAIMRDDHAYGLAKRRVTVSTAGVVPGIDKLAKCSDVALAISLHAPIDALRNELVPLNKKYPIADIVAACKRYTDVHKQHHITIEYVMLRDVNDTILHAKQLVKILEGLRCKVNLIPFNVFADTRYTSSSPEVIVTFSEVLHKAGIVTTTRGTRGDDIGAACGQLVGRVVHDSRDRLHMGGRCN